MSSTILDTIRVALKKPKATADQLGANFDLARRAEADARAAVERQVKIVADGYLDDDATRAAARAKLADLRAAAEDAGLVLAEVERRHAAAVAADEDARRRVVYAAAREKADAATDALRKSYPKAIRDLLGMLRVLAEGQVAAAAANAALPDGAAPIADPEMAVRGIAGQPKEVVSETIVELWSRLDMMTPVDAAFQGGIYDLGEGWGRRPEDLDPCYRLRRFRRVEYRDSVVGNYPTPLAATIRMPHLIGGAMAWGNSHLVYDPAITAVTMGEHEPHVVLGRVAEIEAAASAKPVTAERPLKTEWTLIGDVTPLPAEQPVADTTSRREQSRPSRFGASPFASPARAGRR